MCDYWLLLLFSFHLHLFRLDHLSPFSTLRVVRFLISTCRLQYDILSACFFDNLLAIANFTFFIVLFLICCFCTVILLFLDFLFLWLFFCSCFIDMLIQFSFWSSCYSLFLFLLVSFDFFRLPYETWKTNEWVWTEKPFDKKIKSASQEHSESAFNEICCILTGETLTIKSSELLQTSRR